MKASHDATVAPKQGSSCDGISRHEFLKVGALGVGGLALADLLAPAALGAPAGARGLAVGFSWVPAPRPQEHYSALGIGPDGKVYFGTCNETGFNVIPPNWDWQSLTPEQRKRFATMGAHVFCFDPKTEEWTDVADVHRLSPDLDRGTLPHTKVHTQICTIGSKVYFGSDCAYWVRSRYNAYPDAYPGGRLFEYDPAKRRCVDLGILVPRESLKSMAADPARGKLYIISHPYQHFLIYDVQKRRLVDRAVFSDSAESPRGIICLPDGRVYTATVNGGNICRYLPERDDFATLKTRVGPNNHGFAYVNKKIYVGSEDGRFYEYDPERGPEGTVRVVGPSYGLDPKSQVRQNLVYQPVLAGDGNLYWAGFWTHGTPGEVWSYSPKTDRISLVGLMEHQGKPIQPLCCSGVAGPNGRVYFGCILAGRVCLVWLTPRK